MSLLHFTWPAWQKQTPEWRLHVDHVPIPGLITTAFLPIAQHPANISHSIQRINRLSASRFSTAPVFQNRVGPGHAFDEPGAKHWAGLANQPTGMVAIPAIGTRLVLPHTVPEA